MGRCHANAAEERCQSVGPDRSRGIGLRMSRQVEASYWRQLGLAYLAELSQRRTKIERIHEDWQQKDSFDEGNGAQAVQFIIADSGRRGIQRTHLTFSHL